MKARPFITLLFQILLIAGVAVCQQQSALRLGRNSDKNDIQIIFDKQKQAHLIIVKKIFEYKKSDLTFCFRARPVIDLPSTDCQLGNETGSFDCLTCDIDYGTYKKWTMNSDFSTLEDQEQYINIYLIVQRNEYTFSIELNYTINETGQSFRFLESANTIYEVLSATSASVFTDSPQDVKKNFIFTIYSEYPYSLMNSDNLLMQRHVNCLRNDSYYFIIFSGVVQRNSQQLYMQALVVNHPLHYGGKMWAGISYSKNHVNRDMVGIDFMFGKVYDLYSLYASVPYQDESIHVQGTSDYIVMANTAKDFIGVVWAHYIQFYRKIQTNDQTGDERLMFKINNQYCFVYYFEQLLTDQDIMYDYSKDTKKFLKKEYMHQYIKCYKPDLTLGEGFTYQWPLILWALIAFMHI